MTTITSNSNPALFAGALTSWPLPAGFYYQLSHQGIYAYGPSFTNTYSLGVVRESDGVLIPGIDFYPDGSYGTTEDMITAKAEEAYNIWFPHYQTDTAVAQAVIDIGF